MCKLWYSLYRKLDIFLESEKKISSFQLDPFQEEAINALKKGVSVVVSAPTGSGKTAIAEFVIEEALKGKERVFYTTPLKALSNQKFHDFQKKYGADNVGIVTGDTAFNRDAQILVMTTEIYRNMLYGTVLGSVDENLKHLKYLVLDECHYMNDPERGTVWEESIIYSPSNVQVLALSATIANAKELTEWINNVHGNTELIESFHRPVPLRFYYFKSTHLFPLLLPNKQLNPQLKEHKDSFKAHKQKFKDMQRLKRDEGSVRISALIRELGSKGFLPGIYFVFSRKGCELALRECQELGFSLLNMEEKKTLSQLIQKRIYGNEYLFKHKHLGLLHQGMAVHHAGLLPQWKAIVEELFSKGLIKIVFATETLAAGINMPAKTTIISNLSKRGDVGHKNLSSNQFLQMSGRAGRRGMDEVGNVVIKETHDHTANFAAKLATAMPDPLVSQFTPNYSMVLNLLQNHTLEQIKDLLNKSFGQYLINRDLKMSLDEKIDIEEIIPKLTTYPCPDPKNPGDITIFRKQTEKIHEIKRMISILTKQKNPELTKFQEDYKKSQKEHENYPCFHCPKKEKCYKMEKEARKLDNKLKIINKYSQQQQNFYWNEFLKLKNILTELGYLKNNVTTETGIMASSLRGENILFISEILLKYNFTEKRHSVSMHPSEFAACISSIAIDSIRPRTFVKVRPSHNVDHAFVSIQKISRDLTKLQRDHGVEISINLTPALSGLVENWCKAETKWEDLLRMTNLDEGDIVRATRRTIDLLKHIKNAPYLNPDISNLAKNAYELMDKEPVKEIV